ncbi:MAG TPA: DUF411 domain-containing protein [Sulfolobales archaeon]|nr:DUF411 domain-containing protein [Sulfolobales archaeon]
MRWIVIVAIMLPIVIITSLYTISLLKGPELRLEGVNAVILKDPSCTCCEEYAKYLKGLGARVTVNMVHDIGSKLEELRVPESLWSCHIAIVEGYIVVGHTPAEAIEKLLDEKPPIKGISLPGMPPGSPGMPGQKKELFTIYSFNGEDGVNIYMVI